jgi:DNA excision repair protein ERCC-3
VLHDRAAIIQGDRTALLDVDHPAYEPAREILSRCAELEKSPEHVHTYRLSDLALWNAAATGLRAEDVVAWLRSVSRFEVPSNVEREVRDVMSRYGVCSLHDIAGDPTRLRLAVRSPLVCDRLAAHKKVGPLIEREGEGFLVPARYRGAVKQALLAVGYPVDDHAGLMKGAPLELALRSDVLTLYPYQRGAASSFIASGSHGVVVLPCGAGKTVVAMAVLADVRTTALVVTSGREAASQWRREILAKMTLSPAEISLYHSEERAVAPVTITTYSMLSRKGGDGPTGYIHFDRLAREPFGLIIYDEVHLLPAPVFRLTAELQARRRLGLTATLVREDGRAGDVFALVGPKRYDVPWRELEASGHIAQATCFEVRLDLEPELRPAYDAAEAREQTRIAATNPRKLGALARLAERHAGDRLLVLGTYLEPLQRAGEILGAPVITGETPYAEREASYAAFRRGEIRRLVLSRVGNFAIDLPDANVLIQLSGTMGSRQEEAQRLGRVLRPKPGGASFYTLVTRDTVEQEHALHRQLFLTEQGYRYFIEDHDGEKQNERVVH